MKKGFSFLFLISFLLFSLSCSWFEVSGTNNVDDDESDTEFSDYFDNIAEAAPYLDILNSQIIDTASYMEYSLNGGLTWTDCIGSVQDVTLTVGDNVIVRNSSDTSWTRDLGTVSALSGSADFYSGDELYVGSGSWSDDSIINTGDEFSVRASFQNLGDSSAYSFNIALYLSGDRIIDSTDTLLGNGLYEYLAPANSNFSLSASFTCPELDPGIYYLGAIIDSSDSISELNDDNNVTQQDDVIPIIVTDGSGVENGAFKLVNSWGEGGWENVSDGHYWVSYDFMVNNGMQVWFYFNDYDEIYEPTAAAVFEVSHDYRDDVKITIGLGYDSSGEGDHVLSKQFETLTYESGIGFIPAGGAEPFPDNKMVLDISEFAYALNDYDLFFEVENLGSDTGSLENLTVELYDDYSSGTPIQTLTASSTGTFEADDTTAFTVSTAGNISNSNLLAISSTASRAVTDSGLSLSKLSNGEIDNLYDKSNSEQSTGNDIVMDKYGTGLIHPTKEDWSTFYRLDSIEETETLSRSSFSGYTVPDEIDLSLTQYFPPIGSQGSEGSCVAFSTAYYIHTYTEAKEHGWDLSSIGWNYSDNSVSDGGKPNASLDMIFSPDFIYHQINGGVDEGSSYRNAVETLRRQGCATWDTMPYDTEDHTSWPSEEAWREAPLYRGNTFGSFYWDQWQIGYFTIEDDGDIQLLKSLLAMGYMVTTGVYAGSSTDNGLYDHLNSDDVVSDSYTWPTYTNHAQTIVGYKEGSTWDSANPDD